MCWGHAHARTALRKESPAGAINKKRGTGVKIRFDPRPPFLIQIQKRRDSPIPAEPAAEEFGGEQEIGEKVHAAALKRAGVQAVEACGARQAATLQIGTAYEDRDEDAEGGKLEVKE